MTLDLALIVAAASLPAERGTPAFVPVSDPDPTQTAARRERWQAVVAAGDPQRFARRLTLDQIDLAVALGPVRLAADAPLPGWATTLGNIGTAARLSAPEPELTDAIPFGQLLLPCAQVARTQLQDRIGPHDRLAASAETGALRDLLVRLAQIAGPTLDLEFRAYRTAARATALFGTVPDTGDMVYRRFIRHQHQAGLEPLLTRYPVLGRLLAETTERWVETIAELITRLTADHAALEMLLGGERPLGPVTALTVGCSDPHNGGRTVAALTFSNGGRVIYKPKDLGIDAAFAALIAWLNGAGLTPPLRAAAVLPRPGYGWVEYIQQLPCADAADARRFYQRAGMLVGLTYLLGAIDCHSENLIACGAYPLLIDLETLLYPQLDAVDERWSESVETVLSSGLLPRWEIASDGQTAVDASALGGGTQELTTVRVQQWHAVNTDAMSLRYALVTRPAGSNVAWLGASPLLASDYGDDLTYGLRTLYELVLASRDALLAEDGPLFALTGHPIRFIHQFTRAYGLVLRNSTQPDKLRAGADYAIELEWLGRDLLDTPDRWPIARAEIAALARQDIPYFSCDPRSAVLRTPLGETVPDLLREASAATLRARLLRFGPADLALQEGCLRGALFTQTATISAADVPPADPVVEQVPAALLVLRAQQIAEQLAQRAFWVGSDDARWLGVVVTPDRHHMRYEQLGTGLYDGAPGVALFLAALARITGDRASRALALAGLRQLRLALRAARPVCDGSIGGATGLGGALYALTRCAALLDDGALHEDAVLAARQITPAAIAADRRRDVIGGAAGAILGLLALDRLGDGAADPLARAVACGQHLLAARVTSPSGLRTWRTPDGRLLAGFAHGAAGYAYALLALHAAAPAEGFAAAAAEAIAFERTAFDPTLGDWRDLRAGAGEGDRPSAMRAWCSGAAGIGLARIGGLPSYDTADVRADIAAALAACAPVPCAHQHLCCGDAGRLELGIVAAERLGQHDPALLNRYAARLLHGAPHEQPFNPSLFQGSAGIGYTLLRLADPAALPSVLLWA